MRSIVERRERRRVPAWRRAAGKRRLQRRCASAAEVRPGERRQAECTARPRSEGDAQHRRATRTPPGARLAACSGRASVGEALVPAWTAALGSWQEGVERRREGFGAEGSGLLA